MEDSINKALDIYNEFNEKYDNGIDIYTALLFFKTEKYNEPLSVQTEQAIFRIKDIARKKGYIINEKITDEGIEFYNEILNALDYIINN